MYYGSWDVDDYLTFTVNTKGADFAAVDADADPAYRIYSDETSTAVVTGTLTKLDDGNTLGFYSEKIRLTAANGFAVNTSYTIYISYAISSTVKVETHTLQIGAAANLRMIESLGTDGNNATLKLANLEIVATAGSAVIISGGSGSSAGIAIAGGTTGHALQLFGGASSGHGVAISTTDGDGINIASLGIGGGGIVITAEDHGMQIIGDSAGVEINSTGGMGMQIIGDMAGVDIRGTTADGLSISTANTSGNYAALYIKAAGSLPGVYIEGGPTGDGLQCKGGSSAGDAAVFTGGPAGDGIITSGGSTSGIGLKVIGTGTGDGLEITGGASEGGHGVKIAGGTEGGMGIYVLATGNYAALQLSGAGAGAGLRANGGDTGHGISAIGGTGAKDIDSDQTDVLTLARSENAQGVPPATPTLTQLLMYLYAALVNKGTETNSLATIYNSSDVALCKAAVSDDGTTFTKVKMVTGA